MFWNILEYFCIIFVSFLLQFYFTEHVEILCNFNTCNRTEASFYCIPEVESKKKPLFVAT